MVRIIFASKGFGGRVSDIKLVETSDFLDRLSAGCHVLADLGFKGIATSLKDIGCVLVRPFSAVSESKLSRAYGTIYEDNC